MWSTVLFMLVIHLSMAIWLLFEERRSEDHAVVQWGVILGALAALGFVPLQVVLWLERRRRRERVDSKWSLRQHLRSDTGAVNVLVVVAAATTVLTIDYRELAGRQGLRLIAAATMLFGPMLIVWLWRFSRRR